MFPLKDDTPSDSAPVVTVALIVLNALVYLYQFSLQVGGPEGVQAFDGFIRDFGLVPCRLTGACRVGPELPSPILTIFTSMFMHGGLFHIGGGAPSSWFQFARLIFEAAGLDPVLLATNEREYRTPARRPKYSALSNAKMERMGLAPMPSLREARGAAASAGGDDRAGLCLPRLLRFFAMRAAR